ncbi:hypothetical protein WA158_008050 [Blastocystis sp. Blastoise]
MKPFKLIQKNKTPAKAYVLSLFGQVDNSISRQRLSIYFCHYFVCYYQNSFLEEEKIKSETDLGIQAAEKEDYESALSHFNCALYYSPNDYSLNEMIAQVYMEKEQYESAYMYALNCVVANPQYKYGYLCTARIERELGDVAKSLISYKKAIELDPNDDDVLEEYQELADIYDNYVESHGNFFGRATVLSHETDDTVPLDNIHTNENCTCGEEIEETIVTKHNHSEKSSNFYYSIEGDYIERSIPNNIHLNESENKGFIPKWMDIKGKQNNNSINIEEEEEEEEEENNNEDDEDDLFFNEDVTKLKDPFEKNDDDDDL